jgi:hypothetical protein
MLESQAKQKVLITTPADVSTDNTLTTDIVTALGLPDAWDNAKITGFERKSSAGAHKAVTETVVITSGAIVITEGATEFVAGDVYMVELSLGAIPSATATASNVT